MPGCLSWWGAWWGRWGALVRRHRPGEEPRHPTDGNMANVVFAGVVARDNSAFELVPHLFVGVDVTDVDAIAAVLTSQITAWCQPSDDFKAGGDWVSFFAIILSKLTAKGHVSSKLTDFLPLVLPP